MLILSLVFDLLELRFSTCLKFSFIPFGWCWVAMFVCVCLRVFARMFLLVVCVCVCLLLELHVDVHLVFGFGLIELRFPLKQNPLSNVCWCWIAMFVCVLLLVFARMFLLVVFVCCWSCMLVFILSLVLVC